MFGADMPKRVSLGISILVLTLLVSAGALAAELRVIFINDFHGWAELQPQAPDGSKLGGAAQLAATVKGLRQEKPSLFLAAGDMIQGSLWTNFSQGRSAIDLLNLMGLDAMVVGNHEFDFGVASLQARIREATFPVLGANVTGVPELKPYVIKEVGGLQVAIIGLITPQTARISSARLLQGVDFVAPGETLKKILPKLSKQADVVIILSHLGLSEDIRLASEVKGIDLIVGGHSHTKLDTPRVVKGTIIVQAWEHGKTAGVLDLEVQDRRLVRHQGRLETIIAAGPADAAVQQLIQKYQQEVDGAFGQIIGTTSVSLDGRNVRRQETNLGNFLADVVRQTAGADLAIINGGGIRRSLPAGPIRYRDIHEIIPYENIVVALEVTGRQVRQALEHGLSRLPQSAPRFPQVAGLRLQYDSAAPPGRRLLSAQVGDQPLRDEATYVLATVDFLAAGGDGYWMFPPLWVGPELRPTRKTPPPGRLVWHDANRTLKEIVCGYIKSQKTMAPRTEGRIMEVSGSRSSLVPALICRSSATTFGVW